MIQIRDLHKSFGSLDVLKNIQLDLENKGITAILGPNGSGKTTLIKCILGMVIAKKGMIYFQNKPIQNEFAYRSQIGYLPQIALFPSNLTVLELFQMVKDLRGRSDISETELVQLFELEPFLKKKLGNLSGGTKQKVNLVSCFMFDPECYILDEPTAGLDPLALTQFKYLLLREKNRGKQIIITSHIMSLVEELSDEIVFLMDGRIYYQGAIQDLENQFGQKGLENSIAAIMTKNREKVYSNPGKKMIFKPESQKI